VPSHGTAAQAIRRSEAGIVVEPESPQALAEAILALAQDPDRAERLGRQGRQHALEMYSFDSSLDRYEQLFNHLVKQSRRHSAAVTVPADLTGTAQPLQLPHPSTSNRSH
jgi:colanic acid biosynthesis glycosyl transferase WcaI